MQPIGLRPVIAFFVQNSPTLRLTFCFWLTAGLRSGLRPTQRTVLGQNVIQYSMPSSSPYFMKAFSWPTVAVTSEKT